MKAIIEHLRRKKAKSGKRWNENKEANHEKLFWRKVRWGSGLVMVRVGGWGVKSSPFTWVRRGVIIHANIDPLCIRTIRRILCKIFISIFKILRIYQGSLGSTQIIVLLSIGIPPPSPSPPATDFEKKVAPYMIRKRGVSWGQVFANEQPKVRKMTQADFCYLTADLW